MLDHLIERIAFLFAIKGKTILQSRRGSPSVVRARQIVMYLAHVALQLSVSDVAALLNRDRTSVVHALRIIEDARDDGAIDVFLEHLEKGLRRERAQQP